MRRSLYAYASLAALCAASAFAADADNGSAPDPISKSDSTPAPQTADQVKPASPETPAAGAVGNAAGADPNPPVNAKEAKAAAKEAKGRKPGDKIYLVWVQPGHEHYGIGMMLRAPGELGENLRAAGRARYASDAEIKAGQDGALDVESA
jgi:hypothetical protein